MNKKIKIFLINTSRLLSFFLASIVIIFFVTRISYAQTTTAPSATSTSGLCENLVPCGGNGQPNCNLCHLFQTVSNILNCVLQLGFLLGALLIVFGGVLILLSGFQMGGFVEVIRGAGKTTMPSMRALGTRIFNSVIAGLIIMMLSYVFIVTVLFFFAANGKMADFSLTNHGFQLICRAK